MGSAHCQLQPEGSARFSVPTVAVGSLWGAIPRLADGVQDPLRIAYYQSHLGAVADALRFGVNVPGCMAWSLLDNLEWAHGFAKRFGLVHVNPATGQRTP